jgi:hypothetical protein
MASAGAIESETTQARGSLQDLNTSEPSRRQSRQRDGDECAAAAPE